MVKIDFIYLNEIKFGQNNFNLFWIFDANFDLKVQKKRHFLLTVFFQGF